MSQESNWTLEMSSKSRDGKSLLEPIPFCFHCFFSSKLNECFFCSSSHRYWLFGEKVQVAKPKKEKNGLSEKDKLAPTQNRIRGWFPRNCAVELVNPESDDEHEHFAAKKTN